ncbi:unnamed protein product [Vitrella brassicaformis CCMP3155]|uniref:Uncharacterized protein n=1 Tax=Vitrella brassicaformis (strain CCMP3155) TaxID=1169540 RepID=A0A0G4FVV1_VITBC|nr:unnamed protein product [Vitrella brassicaformis CCMP3155]|eukprot:CEM19305.1 unnamed protein product [Vitrella brassicaformis CCMP3155]
MPLTQVPRPTAISIRCGEEDHTFEMKMRSEKGALSKVYQGVYCGGEEAAFKTVMTDEKLVETDIACLISERQRLEDLAKLAGGSANLRERGFLPLYHASTDTEQPAMFIEGEGDEATKRPIIVPVTPWVSSGDDPAQHEFIEIGAAISRYNMRKISQQYKGPLSATAATEARKEVLIGIRAICLLIHAHITASNALLYALDNLASDVFLRWTSLVDREVFLSCCPCPSTTLPRQPPFLAHCPGSVMIDPANALRADQPPQGAGRGLARVPTDHREQKKQLQIVGLKPFFAPPETTVLRWETICEITETRGVEKEVIDCVVEGIKGGMKECGTMTKEGDAIFISSRALSWGVGHHLRHFVSGDSYSMLTNIIYRLDAAFKQAKRENKPAEEVQELQEKLKRERLRKDLEHCFHWSSFCQSLFDNDGLARNFRPNIKPLHKREETELEWATHLAKDISRLAQGALQQEAEKRPELEDILRTMLELERRLSSNDQFSVVSDEAKRPTGSSDSEAASPSLDGVAGRVLSSGMGETGSLPSCLEMPSSASKLPPPATEERREAVMAAETDEVTLQQQQQQQQQQQDQQERAANSTRARWSLGSFFKRLWSRRVRPTAQHSKAADEENWSLVETQEAEGWVEDERRRDAEQWQWVVFEAAMEGGV